MVMMDALGVKLGFGFSAGPVRLCAQLRHGDAAAAAAAGRRAPISRIYYRLFRFCILRFDLKTPGREPEPRPAAPSRAGRAGAAAAFVAALGGAANLREVDACTTRLRLVLADPAAIDEARAAARSARAASSGPAARRCRSCWGRSPTPSRKRYERRCAAAARRRSSARRFAAASRPPASPGSKQGRPVSSSTSNGRTGWTSQRSRGWACAASPKRGRRPSTFSQATTPRPWRASCASPKA